MKVRYLILSLLTLYGPLFADAYPEFTRFHYNTCMACHIAPSGGGLITSYGRSLSYEVASRWGNEKQSQFLHGVFEKDPQPELTGNSEFLFGGEFRFLQVHKNDQVIREGYFFPMQMDFSAAYVNPSYTLFARIGELDPDEKSWKAEFREYYVLGRVGEEYTLRAGKFTPQYGINIPDHIYFIKSLTDLGMESQRRSIEGQFNGENWIFNLTLSQQSKDAESGREKESTISSQVQYYFQDSFKVAGNIWSGQFNNGQKTMVGAWGVLPFLEQVYLVSEVDAITIEVFGAKTNSLVRYNKLAYNPIKGLDLFIHDESMSPDTAHSEQQVDRQGIGFQFFPIPHFDLTGIFTIQKQSSQKDTEYAWIMLHYYL